MYLARRMEGENPYVYPVEHPFLATRAWGFKSFGAPDRAALGHTPAQALALLDGGATPRLYQVNKEDIES